VTALLARWRIAARTLLKQPGFTLTVVGMLSVAIGANTAIFSLIDRALLRALPFEAPDRLVLGRATFRGVINPTVSGYDYYDYRDESRSFERLAAIGPIGLRRTVLVDGQPDRVEGLLVTWDLFRVLRVTPALGRDFTEAEAARGHDSVAIISDGYWQRRFGGSPAVLDRTIIVDGVPLTVIGVMPPRFRFMADVDVWTLTYRDGPMANARRFHNLLLVGRLASGVDVARAQAEVDVVSARLQQQYPDNRTKALRITPLQEALAEDVRGTLWLLMGAVALVLLMACANAAGLLLARGQQRVTEVAVRSALGASRATLIRQFLAESLILALASGGSGLALAIAFQRLLVLAVPVGRIALVEPGLNLSMLGFAVAASVVTGLAFGVLPALSGTRVDVIGQLKSGSRTTEGRVAARLRGALVVLQVALGVLLLVGAGLLLRSLSHQVRVDLGFDPTSVVTAGVRVSQQDYPEAAQRVAFFTGLVDAVEALPGVQAVGLTSHLPLRHGGGNYYVRRPGDDERMTMDRSADFRVVLPGYFETMRMPFVAGRDLADSDTADRPRVTVISQSLAAKMFPGENPIGQTLIVDLGQPIPHEIVGIVGDARLREIRSDPFHAMYMSLRQAPQPAMYLAVRTASDPGALVGPMRDLLRRMDATVALAEPSTLSAIVDEALASARIVTVALGLFAAVALALALVGLYGVLAYYVAQHQREIGVRMALGASARDVLSMVLGRGLALTALGLAAGLTGALLAGRVLSALLYETTATDPLTFGLVAGLFLAVSALACLLPAWRASRVNPVDALRIH